MKVACSDCEKPLGEITGRLLKGWVILCRRCNEKREAKQEDIEIPGFLKDLFK